MIIDYAATQYNIIKSLKQPKVLILFVLSPLSCSSGKSFNILKPISMDSEYYILYSLLVIGVKQLCLFY